MLSSSLEAPALQRRRPPRHRVRVAGLLVLAAAGLRADGAHAALEPLDAFGGLGSAAGQLAPGAAGVAVSPSGWIHVADPGNHRVQSFTPAGAPAGSIPGLGAGAARLDHPAGVAADAAGGLYVTESHGHRLLRYTARGELAGTYGGPETLRDPRGVAVAADGSVLVVDAGSARVRVFAPSGTVLGSWGSRGTGPGQFTEPDGIAVGPDGDVHVTDPAAGRVQRFSPTGRLLGALDASALLRPAAVAVDRTGDVHVADAARDRVVTFGAGGASRAWSAAPASSVTGLATDCRASVYVVDGARGLVRRFGRAGATPPPCSPPTASLATASATVEQDAPVLLDGSASADDGRIVRWDWDLDGDGVFEQAGGGSQVTHAFGRAGVATVGVRITDDDGEQAQATTALTVRATPAAARPAPPPLGPVLGRTMRAETTEGTVRFRRPGASGSTVLRGSPLLPAETRFDTTQGRVRLTLAIDRGSATQSGTFWGGTFTTFQGTNSPLTDLVLADGEPAGRATTRAGVGRAAAVRRRTTRSRLWGDAKGRFRTSGRNAVATVRGTRWLTEDGARGTTVRVVTGVVAVRDEITGKTVEVRSGGAYLAKDACESRRRFRIRLRVPAGARVRSASVEANGRPTEVVRRDGRLTALVDLRGLAEGVQRVRIVVVTTKGVRLAGSRSYRTCEKRLAGGAAPAL